MCDILLSELGRVRNHAARLVVGVIAEFFCTKADLHLIGLLDLLAQHSLGTINEDEAFADEDVSVFAGAVFFPCEVFVYSHWEGSGVVFHPIEYYMTCRAKRAFQKAGLHSCRDLLLFGQTKPRSRISERQVRHVDKASRRQEVTSYNRKCI